MNDLKQQASLRSIATKNSKLLREIISMSLKQSKKRFPCYSKDAKKAWLLTSCHDFFKSERAPKTLLTSDKLAEERTD